MPKTTVFQKYDYVILDFDETIATLNTDWSLWFSGIAKTISKYESGSIVWPAGKTEHEIQNIYIEKFGNLFRMDLLNFAKEYEEKNTTAALPVPGMIQLVNELSLIKKLYVWSTNTKSILLNYLDKLDILDKFTGVVSRDDVFFIKPKPDGFYTIYNTLDKPQKSQFVFVGDSTADSGAAETIGIDFIQVSTLN